MNIKFVVSGVIIAVPVALIALVGGFVALFVSGRIAPPPEPTPAPPTILVPRGELPEGPVGLREWARYVGEDYGAMSCGFMFHLDNGDVVGVTVAHTHSIGDHNHPLERIALGMPGRGGLLAEFDTLQGPPGRPRSGDDMRVDYILMHADQEIDQRYVLEPDLRGAPQPGERVALLSGLGGGDGPDGQRMLSGTVQAVSDEAVWVLMDDLFMAGSMSGSPFVSRHTGQVVGMLIAGTVRGKQMLLAMHPIGSLLSLAEEATEFPKMSEFVK